MKITKVFEFKRGQKITLDDIYYIQGFIDDCWKHKDNDDLSEDIVITKGFKIIVIVEKRVSKK